MRVLIIYVLSHKSSNWKEIPERTLEKIRKSFKCEKMLLVVAENQIPDRQYPAFEIKEI